MDTTLEQASTSFAPASAYVPPLRPATHAEQTQTSSDGADAYAPVLRRPACARHITVTKCVFAFKYKTDHW